MKTCLHCSDKEGPLAFFVVVVVLPDDQYDSPSFYDLNCKISGEKTDQGKQPTAASEASVALTLRDGSADSVVLVIWKPIT